jgi:hypothetical protein
MIKWLKWIWQGRPFISYEGYNCGICGKWIWESFTIPTYKSAGEWWDTWGLCSQCCIEGKPQRLSK